jgi:hypothetical protein
MSTTTTTTDDNDDSMVLSYRAYKTNKPNLINETYAEVILYNLVVEKISVNKALLDYYDNQNPHEEIIVVEGAENYIRRMSRDSFFSKGVEYILVPTSLQMKKYRNIPFFDLELLEGEVKAEGATWAGCINNQGTQPGGEITAILTNTNELQNLHPIIEDMEKMTTYHASAYASGGGDDTSDSYTEFYKLHDKPCGWFRCPVHYGNLQVLEKPTWFIAGLPVEGHPAVITLRAKKLKERKLKHLYKLALINQMSMKLLDSVDSASDLDNPSYYNESS